MKLTHEKLIEHEWTKATARAYLRRFCLNMQCQDEIIDCANNCSLRQYALEENDVKRLATLDALALEEPTKHKQWEGPAIWDSGINIQQLTKPCMHLLFLGLMKNNAFKIQEWTAMRNQYAAMQRELEERTVQVKQLHLGWCKVQPYRGESLGAGFQKTSWVLQELRHGHMHV